MSLTKEQNEFLSAYCNYQGDLFAALDATGIEYLHLRAWRNQIAFEDTYRSIKRDLIESIKENTYMKAIRKINDIFTNGFIVTNEYRSVLEEGKPDKVTRKVIKAEIPAQYYQFTHAETSTEKAISVLMQEGIISADIAKTIKGKIENTMIEVANSFDNNEHQKPITEVDTIALIKQAVLGGVDVK